MKKLITISFALTFASTWCLNTLGSIPDSRYQYADDCEYDGLLILPWTDAKVDHGTIEFRHPKCIEVQQVAERYREAMLFNGTIKLVAETVVVGFSLLKIECSEELKADLKKLFSATSEEMSSSTFISSISSLVGRKDIVEYGGTKVGGKNAFWGTCRMERRIGSVVVYRGLQRIYMIPLKGGNQLLSACFVVSVLGADEMPYADFKSFKPVGEKFINSITIKDKPKWKFW